MILPLFEWSRWISPSEFALICYDTTIDRRCFFRKKWHKSLQFKETTKLIKASSFHLIVCTEIDHPTWDRKLMALLSSILLLGFHLESPSWLGTRGTVTMCPSRKAAPESVNAISTCKKFSTRCLLLWPQSQLWRASLGSSHWPNMKHVEKHMTTSNPPLKPHRQPQFFFFLLISSSIFFIYQKNVS